MPTFQKHIVAFVDLLGFRAALRQPGRTEEILGILQRLSAFSGDFYAESRDTEDGGRHSQIRPAISAFSDNIVISYNLDKLESHGLDAVTTIFFLQNMIAYIAWNAFNARLLVRGGVAVGDLYHAGGVVYGPALVEAYEMERAVAVYPRIALGTSVSTSNDFDKWSHNLGCDQDGVYALGYLQGFVMRSEATGGQFDVRIKSWINEVRRTIDLERSLISDVKALTKWTWFKARFEEQVSRMPNEMLESDGSAGGA